jgi:peptide/nickel transport system permease protein
MGMARFVRAEFLALREQDFVLAARALGLPERRIIFRHMVPNAIAPVLVSATIGVASAILTESALSFLGIGVPPPFATWGNILADGRSFIFDAPWLFFVPGLAILVVVLAFNLVGEGLREALNPRLRRRR